MEIVDDPATILVRDKWYRLYSASCEVILGCLKWMGKKCKKQRTYQNSPGVSIRNKTFKSLTLERKIIIVSFGKQIIIPDTLNLNNVLKCNWQVTIEFYFILFFVFFVIQLSANFPDDLSQFQTCRDNIPYGYFAGKRMLVIAWNIHIQQSTNQLWTLTNEHWTFSKIEVWNYISSDYYSR